jgi:hypothetical protein
MMPKYKWTNKIPPIGGNNDAMKRDVRNLNFKMPHAGNEL